MRDPSSKTTVSPSIIRLIPNSGDNPFGVGHGSAQTILENARVTKKVPLTLVLVRNSASAKALIEAVNATSGV